MVTVRYLSFRIASVQRYLSTNTVASQIISGWRINAIVTVQSGTPFIAFAPDVTGTNSGFPALTAFADRYSGGTTDDSKYVAGGSGFYINPASFALPAPGQFGNRAPYASYGRGIGNVDLSLFKKLRPT